MTTIVCEKDRGAVLACDTRAWTLAARWLLTLLLCVAASAQAQVQRSFLDPGFEQPALTLKSNQDGCYVQLPETLLPGWNTTHPDATADGDSSYACASPASGQTGKLIELWRNNFQNVPAREGVNFAELNAQEAARLFQSICLTKGEHVKWQLSHRGRDGADVMSFNIDSSSNQIFSGRTDPDGNGTASDCGTGDISKATCNAPTTTNTWADYSGEFDWNGSTGTHDFGFEAISSASGEISVGNFLDNIQIKLTPYIELALEQNSGSESSGASKSPQLKVTGEVSQDIQVKLRVNAGNSTAVRGQDFNTPNNTNDYTITIPAGVYDGSQRFGAGIALIDDKVIENNETVVLEIVNDPSYTIASTSNCGTPAARSLTYTITDDDIDLRTTKSTSNAAPKANAAFTYTVTYENNTAKTTTAPTTSHDVTAAIHDNVPTGITFQSWTCSASNGATCPAASGNGAISGNAALPAGNNGAAGGKLTYTVNAVANGNPNCGKITNTSTIDTPSGFSEGTSVQSGYNSPAPGGTANNSATADVDPVCPTSLKLSKTTTGGSGGPFNFSLTNTTQASGSATTTAADSPVQVDGDSASGVQAFSISNNGADVTINESGLPAGWTLSTADCKKGGATVGSLSGTTWTIPAAQVSEDTAFDCTFTNARAPQADLSITKTNTPGVNGDVDQSDDTVIKGKTTTYTLTVRNAGPDSVTGPKVIDRAADRNRLSCPGGTTVSCSSSVSGGCASASTTLDQLESPGHALGTLPANSTATLRFSCTVN